MPKSDGDEFEDEDGFDEDLDEDSDPTITNGKFGKLTKAPKELTLAEALQPLIASYSRYPQIHLEIDHRKPTSMTGWATKTPKSGMLEVSDEVQVFLTNQLAPEKLRGDAELMDIFYKGEIAHESGHILYSRSKLSAANVLYSARYRKELVDEIANVVDDCWINGRLKIAFNVDPIARTFDIVKEILSKSWGAKLDSEKIVPQNAISSVWLYTLYGIKTKPLKGEVLTIAEKVRAITGNISLMSMAYTNSKFAGSYWRDNVIIPIYEAVKPLWVGQSGLPKQIHGKGHGDATDAESQTLDSDQIDISDEIAKETEKVIDLDAIEKERKERAEREANAKKRMGESEKGEASSENEESQGGHGYGKGTGREIQPLIANRTNYMRMVQKNLKHVNDLLRKLPQLSKPKQVTTEFQKNGRLMTNMLGRIYSQSMLSEVQNVYENVETRNEKTRVKFGTITDFSGSMNTEGARDALTVISEVLYRWLPSEDFAIFVFGSEFSRVKTFDESYDTTRFRLGGASGMGCTDLAGPLRSMIRAFENMPKSDEEPRVIVIFTDMYVDDISEEVQEATKLGIKIMVLGPFGSGVESRFGLPKESMCNVSDVSKLPDAFVKVYAKLGLGQMEGRGVQQAERGV